MTWVSSGGGGLRGNPASKGLIYTTELHGACGACTKIGVTSLESVEGRYANTMLDVRNELAIEFPKGVINDIEPSLVAFFQPEYYPMLLTQSGANESFTHQLGLYTNSTSIDHAKSLMIDLCAAHEKGLTKKGIGFNCVGGQIDETWTFKPKRNL
jgi:hypothetical protein